MGIEAEAKRRFPELMKRAESRIDSTLRATDEQMRKDAQDEQRRLEEQAEKEHLAKAMEAAKRVALEQQKGVTKG